MCGILGLTSISASRFDSADRRFESALQSLQHRGPDHQQIVRWHNTAFGHARLSIIDLDARSHQPMTDVSGRYTIVYNGEIYNFKSLKTELEQLGYSFVTSSDTEVLLGLYMHFGSQCLEKLNGFFAFAVYDKKDQSIFLARDRYGIKPLVYYIDKECFAFASELKALMELNFERTIDKVSLFTYFKFNYIPAPYTILQNHFKLEPGHYLQITGTDTELILEKTRWYAVPYDAAHEKDLNASDYRKSQQQLSALLQASVKSRLLADVPVGTFLSGGIDSSIITAIAKQEKPDIEAFSLGFPDMPFYDESDHARSVAKHLNVKHHVFDVSHSDLIGSAYQYLNHGDEPFADSSALNVNLLSQKVRPHVKVALSGDGGDELFGGYHKHGAEFRLRFPGFIEHAVGQLYSLWHALPASRTGQFSNTIRQLKKFSDGYQLSTRDRYWRWAGVLTEEETNYLIKEDMLERNQRLSDLGHIYKKRKDLLLRNITKTGSLNEVLLTDVSMVLPNDMLHKVDSMSMLNALEVRTPMLDPAIVAFAFSLPVMFKVNHSQKKKILAETYREVLPKEVFNRPKRGFEVPLLEWMNGEMKSQFEAIANDYEFIIEQGLFNPIAINDLRETLYSSNPGDSPATAWALMVFQNWYKRYMV